MATKIFVNLPVKDLNRSMEFFRSLGFSFNPMFTDDKAACLVINDGSIYAMLITEPYFKTFTNKEIADATRTTEVLIALDAESREEVEELVQKAVQAGGSLYREPQDYGWMYQHSFADPDGHQWEILYMDMSRMPQSEGDGKQRLTFSTTINAPKEKVWDVLLKDETYRIWTSVFHPGSYAETDWKQGSRALFKTPEGDGMVSKVVLHHPNEVITLEHLGVLKEGKEDYEGEEARKWQGATETYRILEQGNKTLLTVEQDTIGEYADYFKKTWEKALEKVKELAE